MDYMVPSVQKYIQAKLKHLIKTKTAGIYTPTGSADFGSSAREMPRFRSDPEAHELALFLNGLTLIVARGDHVYVESCDVGKVAIKWRLEDPRRIRHRDVKWYSRYTN